MSSTIRTSRPSIGTERSLVSSTIPEDRVEAPYDETAMKSHSQGASTARIRSARKTTAPFSTPTRIGVRPA